MREYGHQCVVWQTAVNPVVALELLAPGTWSGAGVLGPEAFDAVPFLDLLTEYGSPWGHAGGAGMSELEQVRRLVTEIPGPRSLEQLERKRAHVADGVGTTLPVFVEAAGGGVLARRRRQLADRPRLRHRGDHGRQRARRRSCAGCRTRSRRSPTPASWSRRTTATSTCARRSPS